MSASATKTHDQKIFGRFIVSPLPEAIFGGRVQLADVGGGDGDANAVVEAAEAQPDALPSALYDAQGFMFLPGMDAISDNPDLLVRLSRLFGAEVEDYGQTLIAKNFVHETVPEIFIVSNIAPAIKQPPARPNPPLTENGELPTQFPHRRGWHTDQATGAPRRTYPCSTRSFPRPKDKVKRFTQTGLPHTTRFPTI